MLSYLSTHLAWNWSIRQINWFSFPLLCVFLFSFFLLATSFKWAICSRCLHFLSAKSLLSSPHHLAPTPIILLKLSSKFMTDNRQSFLILISLDLSAKLVAVFYVLLLVSFTGSIFLKRNITWQIKPIYYSFPLLSVLLFWNCIIINICFYICVFAYNVCYFVLKFTYPYIIL